MIDVSTGRDRAATALRGLGVTTITVALAAGGHVLGGGDPPDPRLLIPIGALLLVAARPLSRSPLRARTLLPWTLGAQVAVHVAVSWLLGPHAMTMTMTGHHGTVVAIGSAHQVMTPTTSMLLAHLAATMLAIALLVGVDRGVGVLRSWWHGLAVLIGGHLTTATAQSGAARPEHSGRAHGRRVGTDLPGRGPPFALAA